MQWDTARRCWWWGKEAFLFSFLGENGVEEGVNVLLGKNGTLCLVRSCMYDVFLFLIWPGEVHYSYLPLQR